MHLSLEFRSFKRQDREIYIQKQQEHERIAEFFKPTVDLSVNHKRVGAFEYDRYPFKCAFKVEEIYQLLDHQIRSQEEHNDPFFRNLLEKLSGWRSAQRIERNYSALRNSSDTTRSQTPITNSRPYGEIYSQLVDFIDASGGEDVIDEQSHDISGLKLTTILSMYKVQERFGGECTPFYRIKKSVVLLPQQSQSERSREERSRRASTTVLDGDSTFFKSLSRFKSQASHAIKLTTIDVDNTGSSKVYDHTTYQECRDAVITHTIPDYLKQTLELLSTFFKLSSIPMSDESNESKRDKLREIATFEWLFQQASPFERGTPTITKIITSALLLINGFKPTHDCQHNDMTCFSSFPMNLREYLEIWPMNTPFVENEFSLLDDEISPTQRRL